MRVLLVIAARKFSGAGAVAELSCRALRAAGADARLLFLAGRNLEERLRDAPWAVPGLERERSPSRLLGNLEAIRREADVADAVLCHLPHDHLLCLAAGVRRRRPLARSYRHPGHLGRDPFSRLLARRCDGAVAPSGALLERFRGLASSATQAALAPVPLEDRFRPLDGRRWRDHVGLDAGDRVVGAVGKIDAGRGFDRLLEIGAALPPQVHLLVVGHGPLERQLDAEAARLGVGARLHRVGYHEEELPALYAAMDVAVFLAPGSDWGHRMITEAQGCGRPVVAAARDGVTDLVEPGITGLVTPPDSAAIAAAIGSVLDDPALARRLGDAAGTAAASRRFAPLGRQLGQWLADLGERRDESS